MGLKVFISWASRNKAEDAADRLGTWQEDLQQTDKALAKKLTLDFCLPEYSDYLNVSVPDEPVYDQFNADLLAVRIVVPRAGKSFTYNLASRHPGTTKLPIARAVSSMLHSDPYITSVGLENVEFVGYDVRAFFDCLACCCAVLGEPLSPSLLSPSLHIIELSDAVKAKPVEFIDAWAHHVPDLKAKTAARALTLGWLGTGSSAIRTSDISLCISSAFFGNPASDLIEN